jgi:hypothetical protein
MTTYDKFEEVEKDIIEKAPPIIYKYRTWEDNWHKKIITDREIWFAHPHTLNDPYDVRPPLNYIVGNINWDIAKTKLMIAGRAFNPNLSINELEVEVEIRLQEMKSDPIGYFSNCNSLVFLVVVQLSTMNQCGHTTEIIIADFQLVLKQLNYQKR